MVQVENLNFSYGEAPLYSGVNFIIGRGQKVGLVGPNGSGKSTLLKILTGKEDGYTGRVSVDGNFGIVPQEVKHDSDMEKAENVRNYVDSLQKHPDHEILRLFSGLELNVALEASPSEFSGGQKTKSAIARALLSAPEILLLDEPTNFMDMAGRKWVMDFLSKYGGTVIVISHDLELMDNSIDKILAVNPATKSIDEYSGNYTDYIRLKREREELLKRQITVKQKHIKQMEEGIHRMTRFTSTKGVRARVRQQRRIEKEKASLPQMPKEIKLMKVNLPTPAKVGELPIRALNLNKSYGDLQVLRDLNFTIERRQRVALIGPNGAGKSTFIKILMNRLEADSGEVIRNPQLKVGYYSQEFETFDFTKSVLDTFVDETKQDERWARAFLGSYMLADKVFQKVESLSGGEKTRLSIAMLTGRDNNLLILDEPTTYLDVLSQRIILESLKEYKGTMIVVSHTPEFIKELVPDRAYLFPECKMVFWDDELLDRVEET